MKKLIVAICCLYSYMVHGQNTIRPNIYFQNMNYYNVAAANQDTGYKYHISAYARYKFARSEDWNKPANLFVNHIGRIDKISSFYSASYIYDSYSFFDRHTLYAGYTYQLKLPKRQQINFGIRGVFNFDQIKWRNVTQAGTHPNSEFRFTPDLDLGVQYTVRGFTLGVAVKNLISNRQKVDEEILIKNRRELYANISYAFNIKNKVVIAPFALLYMERNFGFDAGLSLGFFNRVNASYAFRLKEFRHIYTLNVRLYKGLRIAVAADHSSIYKDINTDFMLGYSF